MTSRFIDTNVFLRYLTNDDPVKAKRAEALFRDAVQGKALLTTSLLVIAEIVWTLESFYQLDKSGVAPRIEKILNTRNLECPGSTLIMMALDLYVQQNIDFIDAYHAYLLKEHDMNRIVTYDRKHFSGVPWLEIEEP